ncbi:MAG: RND transporter [Desulfovibrionales bacterium]|nr:MAG: RND transporter [Desulfovibrionales bacterium]
MPTRAQRLSKLLVSHPVASLVLALLLALPLMAHAPLIRTVDNVDYFALDDDPDADYYEEIRRIFGNDEFFVIAFESQDIFTAPNLSVLAAITSELERLPGVRDVQSLANVDYIDGSDGYFEVRPFLESIPSTPQELQQLRRQAMAKPIYRANLISDDAQTAAIVVFPLDQPDDSGFRKNLLLQTRQILEQHRGDVERFALAGWTITNYDLSRYMKADMFSFIPLSYLLIITIPWIFFRNTRLTLIGLAGITACVGSTMGLMAFSGITLNNVTIIVPPLVMALALADSVHIFSLLTRSTLERAQTGPRALADVLARVIVPSFLTSVTTAVGFLSLSVSTIEPIREFAFMASAGMVFKFLLTFFLLPPLILLCDPAKIYTRQTQTLRITSLLNWLWRLISRHSKVIICLFFLVIGGSIWSATRIPVETNLLEFFKSGSPIRQDLAFVESRLGGVGSLDISLRADEPDAFLEPKNLRIIEAIQQFIDARPAVDRTMSFNDFLKDMNQSFHDGLPGFHTLPQSRELTAQYLLLYDSDDIADFITPSHDHARITVRISEHSSAGQAALVEEIRSFISNLDDHPLHIRVTGQAMHNVNTIEALVRGQVTSIALATGVIGLIMILGLRSLSMGLISFLPNLFPIVLNFGIMGLFAIPLNTATALIAVVALGIAVDDTIHFLTTYAAKRNAGQDVATSLERTLQDKGPALIITSLVLCAGFSIMLFSNFIPTTQFGILTAVIMLTALVGDLLLLPAVLLGISKTRLLGPRLQKIHS